MRTAFRLAGHQMGQKASGWRRLPFPPTAVAHARGLLHAATDCFFCRRGWLICPAHPLK